jgi:hypothetical protein
MIIPAQRVACIKLKALGNALNMETVPTPLGRPQAATAHLQADGAVCGAFFGMEASLLEAKGFLQVIQEPFQVGDKNTNLSILRSAK